MTKIPKELPDDVFLWAEERSRKQHDRVRRIILEEGGDKALAEFDATMKEISTGVHHAGMLWYSISEAQRRTLKELNEGKLEQKAVTLRALIGRDLISMEGTRPRLTEKGMFLLKHGSIQPKR